MQPLLAPWRLAQLRPGDHVAVPENRASDVRCRRRSWHASAEGLGPHAGGVSPFSAVQMVVVNLFGGYDVFGEDGMKDHPKRSFDRGCISMNQG